MEQEIYEIVEEAIDFVFEGKYYLNLYQLLELKKSPKNVAETF